jgi:hypothetical protein
MKWTRTQIIIKIRILTEQPIHDREFTPDEIGNAIKAINCKKAQAKTVSPVTYSSVLINNSRNL